jgi:hypothetical protein
LGQPFWKAHACDSDIAAYDYSGRLVLDANPQGAFSDGIERGGYSWATAVFVSIGLLGPTASKSQCELEGQKIRKQSRRRQ